MDEITPFEVSSCDQITRDVFARFVWDLRQSMRSTSGCPGVISEVLPPFTIYQTRGRRDKNTPSYCMMQFKEATQATPIIVTHSTGKTDHHVNVNTMRQKM